jgi:uncharacterized membrane protein
LDIILLLLFYQAFKECVLYATFNVGIPTLVYKKNIVANSDCIAFYIIFFLLFMDILLFCFALFFSVFTLFLSAEAQFLLGMLGAVLGLFGYRLSGFR